MPSLSTSLAIVVPCFNGEEQLSAAVESVASQQSLPDELIIVDDGSTDRTGEIADRYAAENSWISVVHTPNRGLAAARNAGIDASTADYVGFLDADDYLSPGTLGAVRQAVAANLPDVVRIGFCRDTGDEIRPSNTIVSAGHYADPESLNSLADKFWLEGEPAYSWLFYVRRGILDVVRFDESVKYLEDAVFLADLLPSITSITVLTDAHYHYYQNAEGMVRNSANAVRNAVWTARVAGMVLERSFDDTRSGTARARAFSQRQLDLFARRLVSDVRRGALSRESFQEVLDSLRADGAYSRLVAVGGAASYLKVTRLITGPIAQGDSQRAWGAVRTLARLDTLRKKVLTLGRLSKRRQR